MTPRAIVGDCRQVLQTFDSATFDVAIVDPPYGDTSLSWDKQVEGWQREVLRVLKPSGSMWVFGSMRMFLGAVGFEDWRLAQDIVWEKHNGSSFHADRFKRVHEHALQFYPKTAKWADVYKNPITTPDATARAVRRKKQPPHTGHIDASSYVSEDGGPRLMRSVIYERSCHGSAIHPTQKPENIIEYLLRYSCPPGGIVLDPFSGSGVTGAVAKRLGKESVLIEIDPEYAAKAAARIEATPSVFA